MAGGLQYQTARGALRHYSEDPQHPRGCPHQYVTLAGDRFHHRGIEAPETRAGLMGPARPSGETASDTANAMPAGFTLPRRSWCSRRSVARALGAPLLAGVGCAEP